MLTMTSHLLNIYLAAFQFISKAKASLVCALPIL
uniref:Uncharacterized protein n=1 Tax=Anguilla anguilla TaxID=7936 RepID=A0A0E9UGE4_ANGAN